MILIKKKSRKFTTGLKKKQVIKDVGIIKIKNNEMVSFQAGNKKFHEVTRKNWGFYATQSINHRLKKIFKTALVKNTQGKIFLMLVEKDKIKKFKKYCLDERQIIIRWLDEIKVKK